MHAVLSVVLLMKVLGRPGVIQVIVAAADLFETADFVLLLHDQQSYLKHAAVFFLKQTFKMIY